MVIDLGKPKVLKGLLAKRGGDTFVRVRRLRRAFAHAVKQGL